MGNAVYVKVYIPKEIEVLLLKLEKKLGLDRSEILRIALLDYLKDLELLKKTVS